MATSRVPDPNAVSSDPIYRHEVGSSALLNEMGNTRHRFTTEFLEPSLSSTCLKAESLGRTA